MCLFPTHIFPKPVYYRSAISSSSVNVPCGDCAACRDARKVAWEDRLCLEVSEWYKNGGIGVLLTFTYDEKFLPRFAVDDNTTIPCFSSFDVKQFLNRVKVRCNREFGKGFYKYFVCSEFGKTTQRPHLHTAFLIKDGTKYVQFCELCRECWSLTFKTDRNGHKKLVHRLGFMFPKRVRGRYVDDLGRDRDPRFRSQKAGAKYVCKYICKDLAYIEDPRIRPYVKKWYFKDCLPKSYKSNNLGFLPVKRIVESGDTAKIERMLKDGIWSPLQQKYIPLWSSAVNRLMYDNVFRGRVNLVTNQKRYDRELSAFGKQYLWFAFKARYQRTIEKMYQRMLLYVNSQTLQEQFDFKFPKLFIQSDFKKYALFHSLIRTCSHSQQDNIYGVFNRQGLDFFDVDSWREFYLLRHDLQRLKSFHMNLVPSNFPYDAQIACLEKFDKFYDDLCRYLEQQNLLKYQKRGEDIEKAKQATGVYGYDQKLC